MFIALLFFGVLLAAFAALPTYIICRYRIYRRKRVTYGAILTGGLSGLSLAMIFIFPNSISQSLEAFIRLSFFVAPVSLLTSALIVAGFHRGIFR
jgi:hypothetical protein